MFNEFEPNVKATITFLKLLKVKVNSSSVDETLQNHPDWPSLLCISDSLNKWNVPNAAGKIEKYQVEQLPVPFIAYTRNREFPLSIVTKANDRTVKYYSKNYNNPVTINTEDFQSIWTGIYLIAEPTNESREKEYELKKMRSFIQDLIPILLFVLGIGLSFFTLFKTVNNNSTIVEKISIFFEYFTLLAGGIVTSLLLWYEIDKNNPLLKKVCTGITKGNCNAILTGKKSKVLKWLSWSEVGFFYFTGGVFLLVFSGNNINNAISLLGLLNILALPYIIFSVYYQWRVAKQWCILCLTVQALLLFGGINFFANNFFESFFLSTSFLIHALLIYLLPALLWYATKPSILRLQESKSIKREYLRIKFNSQIFETLLKKQKTINIPVDGLGIDLGNPTASNTILKVCNPYCGPCSKAHPKIDELLENIPNLKVKIIFTTPNNENNPAIKPVRHLLAIAEKNDNQKIIKQSLDDWYLPEKKDYDLFAAKYPVNGELVKQVSKIEAMDAWCRNMEITFTPTIFINGYQLPDAYGIEDMNYFLL